MSLISSSLSPVSALPLIALDREQCLEAIVREFCPSGFVETLVARQAARDAARIMRHERLLDALEAQTLAALAPVLADSSERDSALLGDFREAYIAKRLEDLLRVSHRNSQSFHDNLRRLREAQAERISTTAALVERDQRFCDEPSCIRYLLQRFRLGQQRCRGCGEAADGSYIAGRRVWDCHACHAQTGLRSGTVMAHSALPLREWFHGIRIVLFRPAISGRELAQLLNIRRVATVSGMLKKIKTAMLADDTSPLAGLEEMYLGST